MLNHYDSRKLKKSYKRVGENTKKGKNVYACLLFTKPQQIFNYYWELKNFVYSLLFYVCTFRWVCAITFTVYQFSVQEPILN